MVLGMSSHPVGRSAIGLLLLRVALVAALASGVRALCDGPAVRAVAIGAATLVAAGLFTRWAALAILIVVILTSPAGLDAALPAMLAAALALTGPGALSLDARLFGRRVITLTPIRKGDAADDE